MKKIVKMLLLAAVFTLALSVSAFAASGEDAGFCNVQTYVDGVEVVPMLADGETEATENDEEVYVDAVRATVTFSNATPNKYYLVVAQNSGNVPTADNVEYINQETAGSGSVSFDVYPKSLVSGKTYTIYISSNDGMEYTKVASFEYYAPAPAYIKGDVDLNDEVNMDDVIALLRHVVEMNIITDETSLAAGEVTGEAPVNMDDVIKLLRYVVEMIDSLD